MKKRICISLVIITMMVLMGCGEQNRMYGKLDLGKLEGEEVDIMGVRYNFYSEGYAIIEQILNPYCELTEVVSYDGKEYTVKGMGQSQEMFGAVQDTSPEIFVLPDTIEAIPDLRHCTSKQIILHDNVKSIAGFPWCSNIETIEFPKSLETVGGNGLFFQCSSLKEVSLSENWEYLTYPSKMFEGCSSLETITIPGACKVIGKRMFVDCESLKEVKINDGITEVWTNSFINCPLLEEIIFPDSVTKIEDQVFIECFNLKHLYLSDNIEDVPPKLFLNELMQPADISGLTIHVKESLVNYVKSLYPEAAVVAK